MIKRQWKIVGTLDVRRALGLLRNAKEEDASVALLPNVLAVCQGGMIHRGHAIAMQPDKNPISISGMTLPAPESLSYQQALRCYANEYGAEVDLMGSCKACSEFKDVICPWLPVMPTAIPAFVQV